MISFGTNTYTINQSSSEKHLNGIQKNRVYLSFIFRNRDSRISLQYNIKQQQNYSAYTFQIKRFSIISHADNQKKPCETDYQTNDLIYIEFIILGYQMGKKDIYNRCHTHNDRRDSPAYKINAEIKRRVS